MPNLLSNYVGGSKPKLITLLTSGTGTYVPTADMARCLVRIQAGGGGGSSSGSAAGGGGAMLEIMIRIASSGLAYTVGAGGAVNNVGSPSSLGPYKAFGGKAGNSAIGGLGAFIGAIFGSVDTDSVTTSASSPMPGVSGGGGGAASYSGTLAGFPVSEGASESTGSFSTNYCLGNSNGFASNGQGTGSGGNSFFGVGGTSGNSPAAGNYGAGGGWNAAGLGGCIEIWDFGA